MGRKPSPTNDDGKRFEQDKLVQVTREDDMWIERRDQRKRIAARGATSVWGHSPQLREIEEIYAEYEKMELEQTEEDSKQNNIFASKAKKEAHSSNSSSSSDSEKEGRKKKKSKKKEKKSKKDKKEKKKSKHRDRKRKRSKAEESEEEWVEVTNEMRQAEAEREKQKEAEMIGPTIPDHLLKKEAALFDQSKRVNYGKDMLRGEAAAMAAYIAQGKRIPRRGEIGLSSGEIADFEKIGYVMSGTRHKSMEATRLRKENQVMTAEEKRVLSGFTQEERKKKEGIVLQQFRSFVDSKKSKN